MPAHAVAVHQHAPTTEMISAGIVEGVQQLAGEAVHNIRQHRSAEPPGRDDHRVERLAIHPPRRPDVAHPGVETDAVGDTECVGVGAQIVVDLLGERVQIV